MHDPRLSKLRFRAWRRGFREADLILGPFADLRLEGMSPAELDDFEALLEHPDPDLYAWIVGQVEPPAGLADGVLGQIRAFRHEASRARGSDRGA
jgi:antitoxin CptB